MAPAVSREILMTYGSVAISSIVAGTGVYNLVVSPAPAWLVVGGQLAVFGAANPANNGLFQIIGVAGTVITTNNLASVNEGAGATIAFPIAGPSNFLHHDKHKIGSNYLKRTYEFDLVYAGAPDYPTFLIYTSQAEAALRARWQRFRVLFNNIIFQDANPTPATGGNTGFNAEPEISKLGTDWDTSRSRGWHVKIEVELPADLPGMNGRVTSDVRVNYDGSRRRTITLSGQYRALGINNARAQYQASIPAYETAVKAYVANGDGSIYELVGEDASSDDQDKNLQFTRVYEELIYNQSAAALDDPAIVQGRYSYTRNQIAPGDSDPTTRRLEVINIGFECKIDKTVTQDLEGFWQNTLKTYLITQVQAKFGLSQMGLVDHQHRIDPDRNLIFGQMTIHATASGGSNLIQSRYTTKVQNLTGKILKHTWDGNPQSYHVYDGEAHTIRTRTWTRLVLGSTGSGGSSSGSSAPNAANVGGSFGGGIVSQGSIQFNFMNGFTTGTFGGPASGSAQSALVQAALSDGPPPGDAAGGTGGGQDVNGWVTMEDTMTITPLTIGLPGYSIDLNEIERVVVDERVDAPVGGGGGGGGGGTGTPAPVATQ